MIITLFVVFMRAGWQRNEPHYIFNSYAFCYAMGLYLHNMTAVTGYLITLF